MVLHHVVDRTLHRERPLNPDPSTSDSPQDPPPPSRLVPRLCWVISGLAILGSLAWITFSEDKSTGIFLGLAAVALSRVLLGDVGRWYEERNATATKPPAEED